MCKDKHAPLFSFSPTESGWRRILHVLEATIWQIGFLGILQFICALLAAVIFCPLAAAVVLIGNVYDLSITHK